MLGDIQGFCTLKSVNTIKGCTGNPDDLLKAWCLQIWDVAVDQSGFMVFEPQKEILAIVDMPDVGSYFYCSIVDGIIIPPGLSVMDKILSAAARRNRKGGYNAIIANMVIAASLHSGTFDDRFLFEKQQGEYVEFTM